MNNYDETPIRSKSANIFWGFTFLLTGISLLLLLSLKGSMNIVILFMGGILIMGSLVFFTAKSTDDVEGGVQNKDGLSKIAPFILCFGVVVLVLTVYLFIASFDWSWSSSGSYGGHKSFTEYGLSYHKPPSYYHYDYSWLKWIFYPIDVFIFLIGCILIRLGLRK